MNNLVCFDTEATLWGLFNFGIAPQFLFYAYIPVICLCLLLGYFIFTRKTSFNLPNKLFFALTIVYSLHLINEIVQWIAVPASIIYFSWSIIAIFYFIVTALIVLFTISFVTKRSIPLGIHYLLLALSIPIIVFLPTELNIKNLDLAECYSDIGYLYTYIFSLMTVSVLALLFLLYKYRSSREKVVIIFGSIAAIVVLLFADRISDNFELFQFNLFGSVGLLILFSAIAYLLSEFNAFGSKVAATKILVIGMVFLIVSEIFIVEGTAILILVSVTGILSTIGGYLLVKSVNREIKQKEELARLAKNLENANARLRELDKQKSEFVSIASHQLRSPLAAIRGYASMVLEGSFGKVEEKMSEPLNRIADSAKMMNESVEDFLSVSRIEGGNMKYELADFNLRDLAENITDDLRPEGFKKGLLLLYKTELTSQGLVHADKGKAQQILHNLINNSLKYTPKGTVTVFVHDDIHSKKIIVDIIDTGIGMSNDTIHSLFEKFTRAKNANTVNIKGTGLGLFVAREMARAMGGDVIAHSDGEGHGSRFEFFLPVIL